MYVQGDLMSRKDKKNRVSKALEAEIVSSTSQEDKKPTVETTGLFNFGSLNIHAIQQDVWGETMQGVPFTLEDYELKMFSDNIFFIERKLGESVVGRIYQLTDDQFTALDAYMTDKYKREDIAQGGKKFQTYLLKEKTK